MKQRLGDLLLERGLLTPQQLAEALTLQKRNGMRLGAALVAKGYLSEETLARALGLLLGYPVVTLAQREADPAALKLVSREFASEHDVVPLTVRKERGRTILTVATSDPTNVPLADELGFVTGTQVEAVLATVSDIDKAIRRWYGPRFSHPYDVTATPVGLEETGEQMTILRRGGAEERVHTDAQKNLLENVPVALAPAPPPPKEESAVMLTEEVAPNTPISAPAEEPIALTQGADNFDESLGALLSQAEGELTAEAVRRLERQFWALMRVLAKKGILNNQDFLAELGKESGWWKKD